MRISINLATRPFADLGPIIKRLRITMVSLAVVAIGLGLGLHALHHKAEEARARDHSLDGDISRITHERQGYEAMMLQPGNAQVVTEAGNLNKVFDEKAFSWTLAMEDLETVLPGGVQVTALEPVRAKDGRITLRLRVVGPRDRAVELVQNLEHSRHFLQPRIVGESSETNGNAGEHLEPVSVSNKVNFELLADYNAAALGEPNPTAKKAETTKGAADGAPAKAPRRPTGQPPTGLRPTGQQPTGPRPGGPGLRRPPVTGLPRPQPPVHKPRPGEPQ
jgi:type IV pilus assembly protein PilN